MQPIPLSATVSTAGDPALQHTDESREVLVLAIDGSDDLVLDSNWPTNRRLDGNFEVKSLEGLTYRMDVLAASLALRAPCVHSRSA